MERTVKWAVVCLCVKEEERQRSAVSVCWRAFVQSGTVSVQLHPRCGLEVFSVALFSGPPAPPGGWGAESHSLSVSEFSSLHQTGGPQLLLLKAQSITLNPLSCPHLPRPFQKNLPWSLHSVHSLREILHLIKYLIILTKCFIQITFLLVSFCLSCKKL